MSTTTKVFQLGPEHRLVQHIARAARQQKDSSRYMDPKQCQNARPGMLCYSPGVNKLLPFRGRAHRLIQHIARARSHPHAGAPERRNCRLIARAEPRLVCPIIEQLSGAAVPRHQKQVCDRPTQRRAGGGTGAQWAVGGNRSRVGCRRALLPISYCLELSVMLPSAILEMMYAILGLAEAILGQSRAISGLGRLRVDPSVSDDEN